MKLINVVKPFTLTLDNGDKKEVPAGVQEVDDNIADHWYTKAHTEPVPEALAKAASGKGKKGAAATEPTATEPVPEGGEPPSEDAAQ